MICTSQQNPLFRTSRRQRIEVLGFGNARLSHSGIAPFPAAMNRWYTAGRCMPVIVFPASSASLWWDLESLMRHKLAPYGNSKWVFCVRTYTGIPHTWYFNNMNFLHSWHIEGNIRTCIYTVKEVHLFLYTDSTRREISSLIKFIDHWFASHNVFFWYDSWFYSLDTCKYHRLHSF